MRRVVLPEKLDALPEDDPGAVANRKDLRKINFLMGNFRWLRSRLLALVEGGGEVSEWAAGDGSFGISLARISPTLAIRGVDLCRRSEEWPSGWSWQQTNLLEMKELDVSEIVIGNFILHQFEDAQLAKLGVLLNARARLLIFNETSRSQAAIYLARMTGWLFRMHAVTKHDAEVSVRAGFRGEELPQKLGLTTGEWRWEVTTTPLGAYRMVAERIEI